MLTKTLLCLASVVYFESRGEPLDGQFAVAEVVMNRVAHDDFPDTVCAVAKQSGQFAPQVRVGKTVPTKTVDGQTALGVAALVLLDQERYNFSDGAHYFHSGNRPKWTSKMEQTATIGGHKFYTKKDKG